MEEISAIRVRGSAISLRGAESDSWLKGLTPRATFLRRFAAGIMGQVFRWLGNEAMEDPVRFS